MFPGTSGVGTRLLHRLVMETNGVDFFSPIGWNSCGSFGAPLYSLWKGFIVSKSIVSVELVDMSLKVGDRQGEEYMSNKWLVCETS